MQKVCVRPPTPEDAEAFIRLTRASISLHTPWVSPPRKKEAYDGYLEGLDGWHKLGFLICGQDDGEILGLVNANEIVRGAFQSAYLGYWIGAPFARQGYMRAGLEAVIGQCFGSHHLHRLETNIQPGNAASIALVKCLGFRREGYSPKYLHIAGQWRDHERWAILNDHWQPVA